MTWMTIIPPPHLLLPSVIFSWKSRWCMPEEMLLSARLGKRPRGEWCHFVDSEFSSDGICTLVCPSTSPCHPPSLSLLPQVKCRHCSWTGSKHATRCARHYQKHHGYRSGGGGGTSSSGDGLSQDAATSSNASTASTPSGRGLKQLHITLNTNRRLSKQQQREAEYRMVLLQLRYGLSLSAMSSPELQAVMDAAESQFRVPCPKTLQRRQAELAAHTKKRVVRRLAACKTVTIGVDMWEDDARHVSTPLGGLRPHDC